MSTSTVSTILTTATTNLGDYISVALPIIIPVVIGIAVLFAMWHVVARLAKRR